MEPTQSSLEADRICHEKELLRNRLIRLRDQLSPETVEQNSRQILERLQTFEPLWSLVRKPASDPVGLYAAFRGEPDIRPLMKALLAAKARVAFPAVYGQKGERHLRFGVYDPSLPLSSFLTPGLFGVPEPPESSLLPFGQAMSVLIVPGVGFDEQGGRLGFGQGYYDRLIRSLPYRPLLIGVAHPFQLQEKPLPMTALDQRLDYVILPDRVIRTQCDTMKP